MEWCERIKYQKIEILKQSNSKLFISITFKYILVTQKLFFRNLRGAKLSTLLACRRSLLK